MIYFIDILQIISRVYIVAGIFLLLILIIVLIIDMVSKYKKIKNSENE